ncbi:uncharacterized protein LOC113207034 [Frankliniella occidentalis]|uniref:Uncharacterized protein LOC113207034 n=1 Tax=Frankliniella occidentalis TaxID=133901 RepID=A0A9C6X6X2_FRAOC|nr:uncharacterized protein LOC113207034 [Frankliniella occidentalis]
MDSDEDWNSSRPSSAASEAMYFGALLDVDMRRPHDHGDVDMRLSGYGFPQVREVENEEQGMSPISNGCSKSQAMELDEVELRLVAQQQQKRCRTIPAAYGDLSTDPDVVKFDQRRKNTTRARRREARRTPDIRTPIPDVDLRELLDRRRALEKSAEEVLVTICTAEAPAEEVVGIPVEVSIEDEEDQYQCPVSSSQGRETPLPPRRRRSSSSSVEELPVVKRKVDIIDLSSDSEPDDPSSRDRSSAAAAAPPPSALAAAASPPAAPAAAAPPSAAPPPTAPAAAASPPAAPAESALAPGFWRPWGAVAEIEPQPSSAPKRDPSPAPRGSLPPTPTLPRPALLPTPRVFRAGAWGECRCSGTCRCGWLHGAGCLECPELQSPRSASSSSNIDVRISSRAGDQGKQRATLQRAQAYSHAWSYGAAVHFAHNS